VTRVASIVIGSAICWSLSRERGGLDDVPYILSGVAEFAACHTGRETVVADGDLFIDECVSEVV
jgi:hypothetical protein